MSEIKAGDKFIALNQTWYEDTTVKNLAIVTVVKINKTSIKLSDNGLLSMCSNHWNMTRDNTTMKDLKCDITGKTFHIASGGSFNHNRYTLYTDVDYQYYTDIVTMNMKKQQRKEKQHQANKMAMITYRAVKEQASQAYYKTMAGQYVKLVCSQCVNKKPTCSDTVGMCSAFDVSID